MKTLPKRGGIVAASAPAFATDVNLSLPNGRGTMKFIDDGGGEGCDTKEYDIYLNKPHEMKLCWNGGGAVYSARFGVRACVGVF
ncbi:hypothetical protein IAG44_15820 [Streptomyces roseirectus]|uniref:Uncharacterized protein n=1 Tax=Streptomyces roseirectus TaxID=2768066 RepID=A0A7H0ID91_9ACTN|nr:hypothetical protein [Streptomyces roseirectus]QNP70757.1 hypothetical protein IAG44_15820 [Streptomyces roseirectus]